MQTTEGKLAEAKQMKWGIPVLVFFITYIPLNFLFEGFLVLEKNEFSQLSELYDSTHMLRHLIPIPIAFFLAFISRMIQARIEVIGNKSIEDVAISLKSGLISESIKIRTEAVDGESIVKDRKDKWLGLVARAVRASGENSYGSETVFSSLIGLSSLAIVEGEKWVDVGEADLKTEITEFVKTLPGIKSSDDLEMMMDIRNLGLATACDQISNLLL
jgi:hypothetical protein